MVGAELKWLHLVDTNSPSSAFFDVLGLSRLLPAAGVPWWCNSRLPHNKAPLWRPPAALSRRADRPALGTCQQHHLCLSGRQVRLPQVLQGDLTGAFPRHRWLCAVSAGEERDAGDGFWGELGTPACLNYKCVRRLPQVVDVLRELAAIAAWLHSKAERHRGSDACWCDEVVMWGANSKICSRPACW